jgi:hypothetical protein
MAYLTRVVRAGKIQMAPLHHEIYWENIATTKNERNSRIMGANGALLAGLTVCIGE